MTEFEFSSSVVDISHFCASTHHPPVTVSSPHSRFICYQGWLDPGAGRGLSRVSPSYSKVIPQASLISVDRTLSFKPADKDLCSWLPCCCVNGRKSSRMWNWGNMKLELPVFVEYANDVTDEGQQSSVTSRDRKTEWGALLQASALG